jgi:ABC-type multidrug transport system fused ATPase/permease subunit
LRPHWKRSVSSVLLSIVQVSFHIQFPIILQSMVGKILAGHPGELAFSFAWLVVVFAAEGIIMYFRLAYLNQRVVVSQRVVTIVLEDLPV